MENQLTQKSQKAEPEVTEKNQKRTGPCGNGALANLAGREAERRRRAATVHVRNFPSQAGLEDG
jgi:hypothetical protein